MRSPSFIRQLCLCLLLVVAIVNANCASASRVRRQATQKTQEPTSGKEEHSHLAARQSQPETPKLESLFTFQSYEMVVDPVAGVPRIDLSLEEQVARIPVIATFNIRNPFNSTDLRIESLFLNGNIRSPAGAVNPEAPAELIPFACGAVAGDLAADIPAYPKIDALTSRNVSLPLQVTLPFNKDSRLLRAFQESCGTDRVVRAAPLQEGDIIAEPASTPNITTVWKGQVKITAMQQLLFGLYLPIRQDIEIKDVVFDTPCPAVFAAWQAGKAGCA